MNESAQLLLRHDGLTKITCLLLSPMPPSCLSSRRGQTGTKLQCNMPPEQRCCCLLPFHHWQVPRCPVLPAVACEGGVTGWQRQINAAAASGFHQVQHCLRCCCCCRCSCWVLLPLDQTVPSAACRASNRYMLFRWFYIAKVDGHPVAAVASRYTRSCRMSTREAWPPAYVQGG